MIRNASFCVDGCFERQGRFQRQVWYHTIAKQCWYYRRQRHLLSQLHIQPIVSPVGDVQNRTEMSCAEFSISAGVSFAVSWNVHEERPPPLGSKQLCAYVLFHCRRQLDRRCHCGVFHDDGYRCWDSESASLNDLCIALANTGARFG